MTLMCWTRILGDTGDVQSGIEKGASWQSGEYNLLQVYTGGVLLQMFDLPDECDDDYSGGNGVDDAWHHIAGSWDGDHIRVYIDATEVAGGPCSGVLGTNEEPLYIGARGGASRWTNGYYDEIKVFNRGLSQAEIEAAMAFETVPAVDPLSSAAALWATLKSAP